MSDQNVRVLTDKQTVMDYRLAHRGGLVTTLTAYATAGLSLEDIAYELRAATGIKVTALTVQRWFKNLGIEREPLTGRFEIPIEHAEAWRNLGVVEIEDV